ncbi:MAG: response regulator [Verrucomicrobiota bacterium]
MKKHILIVDDEVAICDLLKEFLVSCDYRVSAVCSADEAQRVVRADPPQLIISDLQLEDSDGLDMVKSLKAILPEVPVILLTGIHFDPEVVRDTLSKTVTSYLQKTVTLERILAEVRQLIGP